MRSCFKNSVTTTYLKEKNERLCHLQEFLVLVGVGGVPADSDAAGFDDGTPGDDSVDCWAGSSEWVTLSMMPFLAPHPYKKAKIEYI